jgi:hypothetical protein
MYTKSTTCWRTRSHEIKRQDIIQNQLAGDRIPVHVAQSMKIAQLSVFGVVGTQ